MANAIKIVKQGPGGLGNKFVEVLEVTIDTAVGEIDLGLSEKYKNAVAFVQVSGGFTGEVADGKLKFYQSGAGATFTGVAYVLFVA